MLQFEIPGFRVEHKLQTAGVDISIKGEEGILQVKGCIFHLFGSIVE